MSTRRQFLAASLAVPAVWVVPTIVSVPVAWATDIGSRPPKSPPKETVSQPQMGGPLATDLPAELAWTGVEQRREVEVGVAAVTAGGVLWALNSPEKRNLA